MDVKTTILNGDLEEEVYMKQPKGFVMPGNEHKECKLLKSLYGLKQAPKQWHQKFDEVVLSSGFLLNQSDKFSMKDMGEADVILSIKIKLENKGIVITQSHYIEKILKKFNREDCSPIHCSGRQLNTTYLLPSDTAYPILCPIQLRMTKVIKGEFEKIKDVKVEDVPLTCDASLEFFNDEVNRLSKMDDDLFTYEVEVANIPCDSKMDNDSKQEADDGMGYDPSDVAFIECCRGWSSIYGEQIVD
ncbi:zinc finger, CCHC-type containing protein [Tanacetum coccineum]